MSARWRRILESLGSGRPGVLYLVVGIPAVAVLMGVLTLYLAFSNADPGVDLEQPAMSKTSWRDVP